jgi:hypothetical protein
MTDEADASSPKGRPMMSRRARWLGGAALIIGAGVVIAYVVRNQLAEQVLTRQLTASGVDASYRIERVGLTHQRLTDVRIGDPARPDLTAREIDIWLGYGFEGPRIDRVRLRGVALRGRYDGTRFRLGQLDRLLPEPTDEPFELPDLALDIADAGALIDTPWGRVAAGAVLNGNPLRGMTGKIAALSNRLTVGGCTVDGARTRADVVSDGVELRLTGPVSAGQAACPARAGSGRGLLANAHVALPISLDSLRWTGDFRADTVEAVDGAFSALRGRSDGRWSLAQNRGSGFVSARANGVRNGDLAAAGGAVRGHFALSDGRWRFSGGTALAGARLPPAWAEAGDQFAVQRNVPLVGSLLAQFGRAVDEAGQSFGVAAPVRIDGSPDRTRVLVQSAQLRAASGATLTLSGSDPVLGWDGRRLSLGGDFNLHGGGFPALSGALARTNDGGFALRLAPFRTAAADAALAVDRFDYAADSSGNGRFSVAAGLSGPIAGGRVDGLVLPLSGRIDGGRISVDAGCRDLHYAGIAAAGARFGAGAVRACSLPGQPLLTFGSGPVQGGVATGPLHLRGRSGVTPLAIAASSLRFALTSGVGEARGLAVELGEGVNSTKFSADRVTAQAGSSGWHGELFGGSGRIGTVPLAMSAIAGPWRWDDDGLTLDGGLTVTDTIAPERFTTMTIGGATLRYADNLIVARGVIRNPASPTPLANLTLAHRLQNGSGEAELTLIPIRFTPDGLQPQALSALALGVVANVDGTVAGQARIAWTSDGVSSTGRFSTDDTDLAAAFGPVTGLSGTINFDDLLSLTTPAGQRVRIASINPGIEVVDGTISYQMLLNRRVRIEGGQWPFAGGTLRLLPGLIDYAADQPRYLSFDVEGIDAARFLERYGFENITATGVFDGVIPTIFDGNGGRVVGGSLVVRDGGGALAYVGELSNRDLGYFGNLAFGALRSVRYDALAIRLNGNIDGEMLTEVNFTGLGQGPGARNNFLTRQVARLPFAFNIRINAPFRQLLTSARSLYDPTILIDQNLPALIEAEQAERARQVHERSGRPTAQPAVQQSDRANTRQGDQE